MKTSSSISGMDDLESIIINFKDKIPSEIIFQKADGSFIVMPEQLLKTFSLTFEAEMTPISIKED